MRIVADFHTHIYPFYDVETALECAARNLAAAPVSVETTLKVLFLSERSDCNFFQKLRDGAIKLRSFECKPIDQYAVQIRLPDGEALLLIAGRQVATSERLEILGYMVADPLPEGLGAEEAIRQVRESGGVPVLNWAPGKWSFARAEIVRNLIERYAGSGLLVCDTALRPTLWPEPALMKLSRKLGLKVVSGTDPLPLRGEERRIGALHSSWSCGAPDSPGSAALKDSLLAAETRPATSGHRLNALQVLSRLARLKLG